MGKIKLGMAITDIRGSVGGHVFLKGRGGNIVRANSGQLTAPKKVNSYFQQSMRLLSSSWRLLSAAQRLSWNSAASNFTKSDVFSDVRNPTGFGLYMKLNLYYYFINGTTLSNPPVPTSIAYPSFVSGSFSISGSTLSVTLFPTLSGANNRYVTFASRPLSLGVTSLVQKTAFVSLGGNNQAPSNGYTTYVAHYGIPKVGQCIIVRVVNASSSTGISSAPLFARILVTA